MGCWDTFTAPFKAGSRAWHNATNKLNDVVDNSLVGKFFCIQERKTTFTTELRAGTVTFLTMAYILAVNAGILKDSGGPCTVNDCEFNTGQPFCMFGVAGKGFDPGYMACVERARIQMITATAASSLISCFLMGALANMPLALAPGMGINAYFTYTVVGFFGSNGMISYPEALAAAFIEGWIFIAVSILGVRGYVIRLIPKSVMLATAGGIGLFLSFIGLQASEGIGLVTFEPATLVTLGACPLEERANMYTIADRDVDSVCACTIVNGTATPVPGAPFLGAASPNYACTGGRMRSPTTWLGISGGVIMILLMGRQYRGAIMTGILFVTFVSWIPGHKASYLGSTSMIPGGEARQEYFKKVVNAPNIDFIGLSWDWNAFGDPNLWAALISFLYLDFLDCTGTLFSMATFLDKSMPGFIDKKNKSFPRQTAAFCVDGISIVVGSLMGIAPLTVYVESATGIKEGGRTGITAIMVAFFFFLSLFFTPIIASIPPYATGPALVLVGCLMMENLVEINWLDLQQCTPAFLTIALIPLTYSIAYGVIAGLGMHIALYIIWLGYDLFLAYFNLGDKTVKEVLFDAIPEAFQPDPVDLPGDEGPSGEGEGPKVEFELADKAASGADKEDNV